MRRREFIKLFGSTTVAWPLAAARSNRQCRLSGSSSARRLTPIRTGYIEGENVAIANRSADGQYDRLPVLAAELVRRQVAVICAGGEASALAAKAATTTIPIVFLVAEDPVKVGLVASLNRPDTNATGINFLSNELASKRLELLRELVPTAVRVAVLVNPNSPISATTLNHWSKQLQKL